MTFKGEPLLSTWSAVALPRGILLKKVELGMAVSTHSPGLKEGPVGWKLRLRELGALGPSSGL